MNFLKTTFFFLTAVCITSAIAITPINGTCSQKKAPLTPPEKEIANAYTKLLTEPGAGIFTPPDGWLFTNPKLLPPTAKILVIGKGKKAYPPSINLTSEKYSGTVENYLKIAKKSSRDQGVSWKSLGKIETQSGEGELTQIDTKTEWGQVQMMQLFLSRNDTIYVMTAAALKEEFPQFYEEIFKSFHSLKINL